MWCATTHIHPDGGRLGKGLVIGTHDDDHDNHHDHHHDDDHQDDNRDDNRDDHGSFVAVRVYNGDSPRRR